MKKLRHRANGSLAVERAARSPARPNCGYKTGLLDLSIRTKPTTALKNSELYQQASIRRQRRNQNQQLTTDCTDSRGFKIAIVIPSAFRREEPALLSHHRYAVNRPLTQSLN